MSRYLKTGDSKLLVFAIEEAYAGYHLEAQEPEDIILPDDLIYIESADFDAGVEDRVQMCFSPSLPKEPATIQGFNITPPRSASSSRTSSLSPTPTQKVDSLPRYSPPPQTPPPHLHAQVKAMQVTPPSSPGLSNLPGYNEVLDVDDDMASLTRQLSSSKIQ